ncbi:MAG: hypothetical protein OZ948_12265 [Deltaproteobacteria bacterium]|nr:hypothetical protein [Deltaproteobacteria bacterium]
MRPLVPPALACVSLACASLAWLGSAPPASGQTADVVVGVPIRDGQAGRPQPGVIVDLEGKEQRNDVPPPVVVEELGRDGGATVRPRFGGGYVIERSDGGTTEVVPQFGGGYQVQRRPPPPPGR